MFNCVINVLTLANVTVLDMCGPLGLKLIREFACRHSDLVKVPK